MYRPGYSAPGLQWQPSWLQSNHPLPKPTFLSYKLTILSIKLTFLSIKHGASHIDTPPCKINTVDTWRISQGGV